MTPPDSTIVTCPCGVKVRLPVATQQRSFACPKCKGVFATTADAQVIVARAIASNESQTCPICQSIISAGENAIACPTCGQVHHQECWIEVGGCATYGCVQAPTAEKEATAQQPLSAWGDTKKCPVCGESIKAIALKCRYCESTFDSVDPLTLQDLHRKDRRQEARNKLQTTVAILFGVTLLLWCIAPAMLAVNSIFIWSKRKELSTDPFYSILGYSSIALAGLYSILLLCGLTFYAMG